MMQTEDLHEYFYNLYVKDAQNKGLKVDEVFAKMLLDDLHDFLLMVYHADDAS